VRLSSRTTVLIAVAAALSLQACGGGDRATYVVPGHPASPDGPPITTQSAQQAIEDRGADLSYVRSADNTKDLDPRPVDSAHFGTADAGFFDLYVFANEAAARAAVRSARTLSTVGDGGRVVQVLNIVTAQPSSGERPMVSAVEPALRALARTAAQRPNSPGTTTLEDHEGGADQPSGPPA
jgi:hypothetical protein